MKKIPEKILFIAGPSGIGKSYLENLLNTQTNQFQSIPSYTTRHMRKGEINGLDKHFVSLEKFESIKKDMEIVIEYQGNLYGYHKQDIYKCKKAKKIPVILSIIKTIQPLKEKYPNSLMIFLMPIDENILIKNMMRRGDTKLQIQNRITKDRLEMQNFKEKYEKQCDIIWQIENDRSIYKLKEKILNKLD